MSPRQRMWLWAGIAVVTVAVAAGAGVGVCPAGGVAGVSAPEAMCCIKTKASSVAPETRKTRFSDRKKIITEAGNESCFWDGSKQ